MGFMDSRKSKAKHSRTSSYLDSINEEDYTEHKHKRTSSVSFRTGTKSSGRRRSSAAGQASRRKAEGGQTATGQTPTGQTSAGQAPEWGAAASQTQARQAQSSRTETGKDFRKLDIPPFYTDPEERIQRSARETDKADQVKDPSEIRPVRKQAEKVTGSSRGRSGRRSRRRSGGRGCLMPILVILGILVLGYFIFRGILAANFGKVDKSKVKNDKLEINKTDKNMSKYQNIVLFGVDDQDNKIHDKGSRTDSIIIASIRKSDKSVKLMSVYRDTYVSIDGNYDKVNAAYSYGGPELAIRTLNRNLDLNISDFATINFKALADAVDILGGIELTIQSEKELQNLNDYIGNMNKINGGHSPKFKSTGKHLFDGNQAVAYSRIRYMEGGDHARASHQRLVIQGIFNKAKTQPWKVGKLTDVVLPQCKTSLSSSQMSSLFMSMIFMNLGESKAYPFDSVDERYNGIYYGFPTTVSSNVKKAHEYLFGTKDYEPCDELMRISEKVKVVTDSIGLTE